jgi:hypothetical protein
MRSIISISVICFFSFLTQGQELIKTNLQWSNLVYKYFDMPNYSTHFTKIGNEVFINDTTYYELLRSDTEDKLEWYNYGNLRDDGKGKIFYRKNSHESEKQIFDFLAETGDTVNSYDRYTDQIIRFQVGTIDTVIIENVKRKIMKMHHLATGIPSETWISGIGSLSGMPYNNDGAVGKDAYSLLCLNYNDSLIYKDPTYTTCYRSSDGIDENDNTRNFLKIYPNPVFNYSILEFKSDINSSIVVEIFNYQGQIIEKRFYNSEIHDIIDKSKFAKGMYLIKLFDGINCQTKEIEIL